MSQTHSAIPELPDFITLLAEHFHHNVILDFLLRWQLVVYAVVTIVILVVWHIWLRAKFQLFPIEYKI